MKRLYFTAEIEEIKFAADPDAVGQVALGAAFSRRNLQDVFNMSMTKRLSGRPGNP